MRLCLCVCRDAGEQYGPGILRACDHCPEREHPGGDDISRRRAYRKGLDRSGLYDARPEKAEYLRKHGRFRLSKDPRKDSDRRCAGNRHRGTGGDPESASVSRCQESFCAGGRQCKRLAVPQDPADPGEWPCNTGAGNGDRQSGHRDFGRPGFNAGIAGVCRSQKAGPGYPRHRLHYAEPREHI